MSIYLELAARAEMEILANEYEHEGVTCTRYRFDIRNVCGDWDIVCVPLPFASELTARNELYKRLKKVFNQK